MPFFDISLITSIYRSERFLPDFFAQVTLVAEHVRAAGKSLELRWIVNDATDAERALIDAFIAENPPLEVVVAYVPRESLYASWNRGMDGARGAVIGFWNVDDRRTAEGLIEGHDRTMQGAQVIVFPLVEEVRNVWYGIPDRAYTKPYTPPPFDPATYQREPFGGTFFMLTPEIVQTVGGFDPRFRVMGDFDWWIRATEHTDFQVADAIAGTWIKHGDNLTSGGRGELERNVIRLRYGHFDRLSFTHDPRAMREIWREWEADSPPVPPEIADRLWGESAIRAWDSAAPRRKRRALLDFPKAFIRLAINYSHTRKLFYRLGLVKDALP